MALLAGGFTAFTQQITAAGTGTITVPSGATSVVIEAIGASGNSGAELTDNCANTYFPGDGGSGGLARSASIPCSGGQTLNYTVGNPGSATTVSSGTLSITTLTANSGGNGGAVTGYSFLGCTGTNGNAGVGGTASGGSTNITGNAGGTGGVGGGGAGLVGTYATGANGASAGFSPYTGGAGKISLRWT